MIKKLTGPFGTMMQAHEVAFDIAREKHVPVYIGRCGGSMWWLIGQIWREGFDPVIKIQFEGHKPAELFADWGPHTK